MVSAPDGSTTSRDRSAASRTPAAISASTDRDDPVEVRAQVGEGPGAERLGPRAVGDRPRNVGGRPTDDRSGCQRCARIGRELGLDADDPNVRAQPLDRGRDTACQPAAADRHQDEPVVGQVLDDLEPDRALAGDDPVVVERRDDRQTALRGDGLGLCLALVGRGTDDDDLGAIGGDPLALDRRRVVGMTTTARCRAGGRPRATPWAWLPDE